MEKKITVIKGDGIGPEIVTEAQKVLDKVAEKFGHKPRAVELSGLGNFFRYARHRAPDEQRVQPEPEPYRVYEQRPVRIAFGNKPVYFSAACYKRKQFYHYAALKRASARIP